MALSEKNYVSYMKIGKISEHTKQILKLIYKLFGVKFNIRECDEYDKEESEEDIEEENEDEEKEEEEDESDNNNLKEKFNKDELPIPFKQFMFSCVGIGLKNVARIEL